MSLARLLRILLTVLVAGILLVGGLWAAMPENKSPEDGPADPFIGVRRQAIPILKGIGLLGDEDPARAGLLPQRVATQSRDATILLSRDPVSRGLFWLVGERLTLHVNRRGKLRDSEIRLLYTRDGQRTEVSTATGATAVLRGYLPDEAEGFWLEEIGPSGSRHMLQAWDGAADR